MTVLAATDRISITEHNRLLHRVLRDEPPPLDLDAICFFGQTRENDRIALSAIADRWRNWTACPILIANFGGLVNGNLVVRSTDAWVENLEKYGVDPNAILRYEMSSKLPPSTDAEALGMVEVIREKGWQKLVIIVPPLHAERAFASLVSACLKNGLEDVAIWSAPSEAPSWDEDVFHSGSMPSARREDQLDGELDKRARYCAKGDHLTEAELLAYLRRRKDLAK